MFKSLLRAPAVLPTFPVTQPWSYQIVLPIAVCNSCAPQAWKWITNSRHHSPETSVWMDSCSWQSDSPREWGLNDLCPARILAQNRHWYKCSECGQARVKLWSACEKGENLPILSRRHGPSRRPPGVGAAAEALTWKRCSWNSPQLPGHGPGISDRGLLAASPSTHHPLSTHSLRIREEDRLISLTVSHGVPTLLDPGDREVIHTWSLSSGSSHLGRTDTETVTM